MTDPTLAGYANVAVYSAIVVLTLAMIAYALHLARLVPAAAEAPAPESRSAEVPAADLVAAGVRTAETPGEPAEPAPAPGEPATAGERAAYAPDGPTGETRPARQAAGIARSLTTLGTLVLLAGIVLRAASVHRAPLGNMYEFALVGAFFTLAAYLGWSARRPLAWLGVFVVTPAVLILGAAVTVWYTEAAQLMPSLKSVWLAIHVTVATLSIGLFTIGAALAGLYLARDRFGDRGLLGRLPQARALERLTYTVHIVAFPLWTFTVIAGAIWARQAWGSYWNWDPKEVWSFVIWVAYAAYLHARATSGWRRQSAAWIALAGYAAILVNYAVVNVYFVSQHSYSGL